MKKKRILKINLYLVKNQLKSKKFHIYFTNVRKIVHLFNLIGMICESSLKGFINLINLLIAEKLQMSSSHSPLIQSFANDHHNDSNYNTNASIRISSKINLN